MKSFTNNAHKLTLRFIILLSFFMTGILFLSTFAFSYYAEDMVSQISVPHVDNILINVILLMCFVGMVVLMQKFSEDTLTFIRKILLIFVPAFILMLGAMLVIWGRTAPAADAYSVYAIGESFADGNLTAIQPTGDTYLSFYPQQIGLIAYYEIVCRIWNLLPIGAPAYHILKCGNVVFACIIVIYQYRTVHLLAQNVKADILYLLFSALNLPLLFYTSFVYGEIPSFALVSIGIFYLLQADHFARSERHFVSPLCLSALALTFSVMLRKNSLIIVIAVILATFCRYMYTHKHSFAIYAIVITITATNILPVVQSIYELRAGNTLLPGVPAMSYFAMGMQEAERGNGWYNGFNFYTYQELQLDSEATIAASTDAIISRSEYFRANIDYAIRFYSEKFLSQWTDGSYACRQATLQTFADRAPFLKEIYNGKLSNLFSGFCNGYQFLIYAGAFLYLLFGRKKEEPSWTLLLYIGFIAVFGGFAFHTIWEANSRYIFPYGLLLIPYAAMGFARIPQHKN